MKPSKTAKIHVCGVTCHRGDANCNGYCTDARVPHAKLIEPEPVTDATIEAEIQAKGLTAPRVTPADIEAVIVGEHFWSPTDYQIGCGHNIGTFDGEKIKRHTFCILTLRNGFTVVGFNEGPVSESNFDTDLGRKLCRQEAVDQIWPLMGYQLRETLAQQR